MADVFNDIHNSENEVLVNSDSKNLSYEEEMLRNTKLALDQCKKGELEMYTMEDFFEKLDDFLNV